MTISPIELRKIGDKHSHQETHNALHQAADEIERLQAERLNFKRWLTPNFCVTQSGQAFPLSEVPKDVLEDQLRLFREEIFSKAKASP